MNIFEQKLSQNRSMKELIEIFSLAEEFTEIKIKQSDASYLKSLSRDTKYSVSNTEGTYAVPNIKTNILL